MTDSPQPPTEPEPSSETPTADQTPAPQPTPAPAPEPTPAPAVPPAPEPTPDAQQPEAPASTPEPAPTEAATPVASPAETEPTAAAEPPPTEPQPDERKPTPAATGVHLGTGRRKASVARVRMLPGSGDFTINQRNVDKYFTELQDCNDVVAPLDLTGVRKNWDVKVNVYGGGHTGQAGAIRLGLARALVKAYGQFEATLRDAGYLTRDARRVERKKPGQRKARRRFQFSKR